MATYLKLLGTPSLYLQGVEQLLPVTKVNALLFYLAYVGAWIDRGKLVYLFWPDTTEQTARRRLSRLLIELKKLPYTEAIEIEPSRLRWQVKTDTQDFAAALSHGRLLEAVQLYSGAFLETFPHNIPEFEAWLEGERHELEVAWRRAALELADDFEAKAQYAQAAEVLKRLYRSESFDETVFRRYLENLQLSRQAPKAIAVFERFEQQLENEFGGQPDPETLALIQSIRQGKVERPATTLTATVPTPAKKHKPRHNLLTQTTRFIGREAEKARLAELLADPACRLLTILAPGGMGKTRLAVEVARAHTDKFEHGAWFVSLVPVNVPEQMVYAVAAALNINFFGQREGKEQLFGYLAEKELLLVLDNLEQLLSGVQLLGELLEAAPGVKLLVTSRERLDLKVEYVFDLKGLALPDKKSMDAQHFDALQLFSQSAGHHRSEFALNERTIPAVTHICTWVEGMPLAIELAASWLRALSLSDVADELEKSMDLLEVSARDVPPRHRSMRVVFDHSWNLLTEEERGALRRLSVFQEGFGREAALAVADAGLPMLASLVNKSFLELTADGRYHSHPLIVHYTRAKLADTLEDKLQAEERHGLYFLRFVQAKDESLMTLARKQSFALIKNDFPNIKAAWNWAVAEANADELRKTTFLFSYHGLGQLQERLDLFSRAVKRFDPSNPAHHTVLGALLIEQGYYESALIHLEQGRKTIETGLALLYLDDTEGILNGLCVLSQLAWEEGDYPKSKKLADEGLALARHHNNRRFIGYFLAQLATVIKDSDTIPGREQLAFYQAGLEEVRNLGMVGISALFTHLYAFFLLHHGKLEEAKDLAQGNLRLIREFGYWGLESRIIDCLAVVSYKQGDYQQAYGLLQEASATFADNLTEPYLEASIWSNLGKVARALGNDTEAESHLKHSLEIGLNTRSASSMASTLVSFAELSIAQGQAEQAAEWLSLSLHHPATEQHGKIEAGRLLEKLTRTLSPEVLQAATERGEGLALAEVVRAILFL